MYLYDFHNREDIFKSFNIEDNVPINIIFAVYTHESYEGQAFVLFEEDNKLYEVNGNHCSCYGLEDKWNPEATSITALLHRIENGELGKTWNGDNRFAHELRSLLLDYEFRKKFLEALK